MKHIERDVVTVRPNSHLGIVIEVFVLKLVTVICPRGVSSRGDRYALRKTVFHRELRDDPTIRDLVVLNNGVSIVILFAVSAKSLPNRVSRNRTKSDCARVLVEDGDIRIHPLHKLTLADSAVCVRGRVTNLESTSRSVKSGADSVKALPNCDLDRFLRRGRRRCCCTHTRLRNHWRALQQGISLWRREANCRMRIRVVGFLHKSSSE